MVSLAELVMFNEKMFLVSYNPFSRILLLTVRIMHVLNSNQTLRVLLYSLISKAFSHQFPLVTTGWECDTEDTGIVVFWVHSLYFKMNS